MQDSRMRNVLSAGILILVIIIYTFHRMYNAEDAIVTVGVDDSKISIAVDSGEPVFIRLEDVLDVAYIEEFHIEDYPDCTLCVEDDTGACVIITTSDQVYVVNTSTQNATKNIYNDIMDAVSE